MVKTTINDQYCLNKIKSVINYDLKRLSFSESNLAYLTKPLNSNVNNDYKLKYLNCFKISFQIFKFKNLKGLNKIKKLNSSKFGLNKMDDFQNLNLSPVNLSHLNSDSLNKSNLSIYKQLTQSDPELYSTNLLNRLEEDETKDKQLFFLKLIYSTFKSLSLLVNKLTGYSEKNRSFTIQKPKVIQTSTLKSIYNYGSKVSEFRVEDSATVSKELDKDNFFDKLKDNLKDGMINEIIKEDDYSKEKFKEELIFDKNHDQKDSSNQLNDSSEIKDLNKVNLDKVLSCVDLRKAIDEKIKEAKSENYKEDKNKIVKKRNIDASISSLDQDELNRFLNSDEFKTESILNKIESLKNYDKISRNANLNDQINFKFNENSPEMHHLISKDMKPIKSTQSINDLTSPFLKLNFLDNFLTRTLSNTFNLKRKECRCNCCCNQNTDQITRQVKSDKNVYEDDIEIIDLNDEDNIKFYKDNFLNLDDLDEKDREEINLEFDKKFEKFLKEDLEKFKNSTQSPFGKSPVEESLKNFKNIEKNSANIPTEFHQYTDENSCKELSGPIINTKEDLKSGEQDEPKKFDSIECLNLHKSKIPILKRDKDKFSKAMINKLKVKYDPLKIGKQSKELIDALNKDYENNLKIDRISIKINHKNRIPKSNRIKLATDSIRSLKSINTKKSLKSLKLIESVKDHLKDQDILTKKDHLTKQDLNCLSKLDDQIKLMNERLNYLKDSYPKEKSKRNKLFPSRIPKFLSEDESINEKLMISRKDALSEAKKEQKKTGDKLFYLVKKVGKFKELEDSKKKVKEETKIDDANIKLDVRQDSRLEYQYLRKCIPRTKSESFLNEQLDCNRINENYRQKLLDLEFKTNGNCLFQLYDYFDNFKHKSNKR